MLDRVTVYAFVAMWLYALQNVLLEVRLAKYTALGLMVYWYFTLAPLALIGIAWMYWSHQPVKMPGWPDGGVAIAIGTMFFVADYFYISAYTSGGKLMAITTLTVMVPIMAQLIKMLWAGGSFNRYHMIGYVLAALAVILINKGNVTAAP
jgi:drug/metabolite transporter (DMT)-like permease